VFSKTLLIDSFFLENIILFPAELEKDSIYPVSRCRTTMELPPHPNDIKCHRKKGQVSWMKRVLRSSNVSFPVGWVVANEEGR
jgi:hypothetical protein